MLCYIHKVVKTGQKIKMEILTSVLPLVILNPHVPVGGHEA